MTTYAEVAQALADAGYLTDADREAAVIVLQDALTVDAAEDAEAEAIANELDQMDTIELASELADVDDSAGDYVSEEDDFEIMDEAADQIEADEDIIAEAEAVIDAAYTDAAAALLAAELIDEANAEAVAAAIADAWVEE
jgi:hypothetical protein